MVANLGSPRVGVVASKRTAGAITVGVALIVAVEAAVAFAGAVAEPRSSSGSSSSESSSFPSVRTRAKNTSDATRLADVFHATGQTDVCQSTCDLCSLSCIHWTQFATSSHPI